MAGRNPKHSGPALADGVPAAGISSLIWRRILMIDRATIAELHAALQVVFGWSNEHLHRLPARPVARVGFVRWRDQGHRRGDLGCWLRGSGRVEWLAGFEEGS
ncbi:IS1096 element passenger TnpR family protein [Pseudofrankia sp. BMG5.37]|uniref:IS1096 element passenger TnpR family protein n=1 Tax=Pseudofrankia sp. BMG5.37 TaxID=3050035 RepID=UPI0037CB6215